MEITNYWCLIFIFPKMLIKMVNSDYCSFLWHGSYDRDSPDNINWDDWQNRLVSWQLEKSLFGFDVSMGSKRKVDNGYSRLSLSNLLHPNH